MRLGVVGTRWMPRRAPALLFAALAPVLPARGEEAPPIRDNSFLVEEAYNQEEGVVQHISAFTRFREAESWAYTFTQEWPVRGQKHQLSFTLPVEEPGAGASGEAGVGDLLLNYRYQWLGGGEERLAFAPRVSLLVPTGEEREDRGAGAAGVQVNFPVSVELSRRLATHSNAGATHVPSARNDLGEEADTTDYNLGQSLIWLMRPRLNLMVEAAWASSETVIGPGRTSRESGFFVAPGVRGAFNFASGLQIVPGLALPFGLGSSRGENAILLYLSFEHPYRRVAAP